MRYTKHKIKDEIFLKENGLFTGLRFSSNEAADRYLQFFAVVPTETELPNELYALARAVATTRHELCFEGVVLDDYKLFLRLVDELTDCIFKQHGVREGDLT